MFLQLAAILLYYSSLVIAQQQCSFVTVPVCGDDVTVTPGSLMTGRGQKGVAGAPGKKGPRGLSGPIGVAGPVGPKGDVGPPGMLGSTGEAGPKGLQGPVGPKGDVGPPGQVGPRGAVGPKGSKGAVGQKGEAVDLEVFKREMRERLREIDTRLTATSCLMSSENGYQRLRNNKKAVCDDGWTVFQRRFNGSVDFNRTWQEYKDGFGNMQGEFWLGLDKIHRMTSGQNCKLKIKMRGFDATSAYAQYNSFSINDESDNYRLHVSGFTGTAGDSLVGGHNGMQFTTKDRDNDRRPSGNCALRYGADGGWWYRSCFFSKLNAEWGSQQVRHRNMIWYHWKGYSEAIKESTMMIKCD